MLLFGIIVAICSTLILWRALDPANWQVLADELPVASQIAAQATCPPSVTW